MKELRKCTSQIKNGGGGYNVEYNELSVNKAIMDRLGVHLQTNDS